jgi:hypothetical protein
MIYGTAVRDLNRKAGGESLEAQDLVDQHGTDLWLWLRTQQRVVVYDHEELIENLINSWHRDEYVVTVIFDDVMVWRVRDCAEVGSG